MTLEIVTRAQWGAKETGLEVYTTTWAKRTGHYTHYSAGPPGQSVRSIQDYHLSKGWGDIGYNWLVDVEGRLYEGRRGTWMAIGAHAANNNTANIGTCFIGRDTDVTDAAKRTIRWVYDEACRLAGRALAKRYHSMTSATTCPGDQLRNWVIAGMAVPLDAPTPEEETDMKATDTMNLTIIGEDGAPQVYGGVKYEGYLSLRYQQEMQKLALLRGDRDAEAAEAARTEALLAELVANTEPEPDPA